jgi:AAA ATPase domain
MLHAKSYNEGESHSSLVNSTMCADSNSKRRRSSILRSTPSIHRTFSSGSDHSAELSTATSVSSDGSTRRSSTTPIAPSGPKVNDLSDFRLNKLRFSNLALHGRDNELRLLRGCSDSIMDGTTKRQLVLLSGLPGTGKSRLADSLREKSHRSGLYVRGKFDPSIRNTCDDIDLTPVR